MENENRKIVLAIDDATINLRVITTLLNKEFDVRCAKSGEIALFVLGSTKVDLILLDIEMPGMSGFDFLKIIKELPDVAAIPIIMVTSHATPSFISRALSSGAMDYIVKPIDAEALRQKAHKALGI